MKTSLFICIAVLALGWAGVVHAAPTAEQIATAAGAPDTELAPLLTGASTEETASIVASVIDELLTLDLEPDVLNARLESVMSIAINLIPPENQRAFANALRDSLDALEVPASVLTTVRSTLVTVSGETTGASFDRIITTPPASDPPTILHPQPVLPEPVEEDEDPTPEPPAPPPAGNEEPPIVDPYPAQNL